MRLSASKLSLLSTAFVLLLLFTICAVSFDGFFSMPMIANLLRNNAYLGIMAVGMTFVILSKGIDLSVGAVYGFTTVLLASLYESGAVSGPLGWAIALGLGLGFGLFMGTLIVRYELPPFLVTLGGMFFARGMAFVITEQSLNFSSSFYDSVANIEVQIGPRAYVGLGTILFAVVFLAALYVLNLTRFGRSVYAVGGNEDSARLMGLSVDRIKISVYGVNGFCAALAGVLGTMSTESGNPVNGNMDELDTIASVVIGGTLLTGGKGGVFGTLLGVLIFAIIKAIPDFGNISSPMIMIIKGGLLLSFILLQAQLSRIKPKAETIVVKS
ncbi:MAG: sugar ABC transporter permease YjfF [Verrucomicrobiota bacterium]